MSDLMSRSYQFEVRAEQDEKRGRIITGRPIVFGQRTNIGPFDEVIERGALNTTDLRDVVFLVNHDDRKLPLARSRNNNSNSTMQLGVDDNGMAIRVNLDVDNNADARALDSAVQRGDISGMSFRFSIDDDEWENLDSEHPTRHIRSISRVVEVSAVTFPAYSATEIQARDQQALDNARSALDSARSKSLESDLELAKLKIHYLYD